MPLVTNRLQRHEYFLVGGRARHHMNAAMNAAMAGRDGFELIIRFQEIAEMNLTIRVCGGLRDDTVGDDVAQDNGSVGGMRRAVDVIGVLVGDVDGQIAARIRDGTEVEWHAETGLLSDDRDATIVANERQVCGWIQGQNHGAARAGDQ